MQYCINAAVILYTYCQKLKKTKKSNKDSEIQMETYEIKCVTIQSHQIFIDFAENRIRFHMSYKKLHANILNMTQHSNEQQMNIVFIDTW